MLFLCTDHADGLFIFSLMYFYAISMLFLCTDHADGLFIFIFFASTTTRNQRMATVLLARPRFHGL